MWNANTVPREGQPGQLNYMATSPDLVRWSPPAVAFSSPRHATNPVNCTNPGSCIQWQPNLFALRDGRLGCTWSGTSDGLRLNAVYFSTLDMLPAEGGRWTNHLITFEPGGGGPASPYPFLRGANWSLFASQNPTTLRSGRILAPVDMTRIGQPVAPDAPAGCLNRTFHNCVTRLSSVLYSDDGGVHWTCSAGTSIPHASWANWEPTTWEARGSESVHMFSRYNDFRNELQHGPPADRRLQWTASTDQGASWGALQPVPVDTIVSRMQVMAQLGADGETPVRWLMVAGDWNPGEVVGCAGRLNTALWLAPASSRPMPAGAAASFAPGIGLSEPGVLSFYPQMWQDNATDTIAVVWSSGYKGFDIISDHL